MGGAMQVMFALFTSILISWGYYMWQQRQYVQRVHYLMAGLCLFKSLTVMSQAGMYHYIERTGSADGWNIAYYIFTFFRGILFFVVVVLIGTGWSYMVCSCLPVIPLLSPTTPQHRSGCPVVPNFLPICACIMSLHQPTFFHR